jgi:predicted DNA-binding transcriptional regulator AlpA
MTRDPISLVPTSTTVEPFASERLLTAADVAAYLRMPPKKVYELAIPRVEISRRRLRWLESDVLAYVQRHRRAE